MIQFNFRKATNIVLLMGIATILTGTAAAQIYGPAPTPPPGGGMTGNPPPASPTPTPPAPVPPPGGGMTGGGGAAPPPASGAVRNFHVGFDRAGSLGSKIFCFGDPAERARAAGPSRTAADWRDHAGTRGELDAHARRRSAARRLQRHSARGSELRRRYWSGL